MAKNAAADKAKPEAAHKKDAPKKDGPKKEKDAPKKEKAKGEAAGAATATEAPPKKAEPAPRAPADPRLKVLKKFQGKFLPKGVLRERYQAIMKRWDSGDDRGGVTVEELKKLLDDWLGTREKPPRLPKA
jgi:hypothetical protein